ncbi:MAG: hypothetical protein ACI8XX_001080 [Polaribacter sp.]|jgi:hypothetical protein
MKVFFSLLLIANIAFGLMQWLLPYEQLRLPLDVKKIPVAEKLRLLNEPGKFTPLAKNGLDNGVEANISELQSALVVEDTSDKRLCFTTGPFKDKSKALEVSGRYSSNSINSELKSVLEKEYLGVMVYIAGNKNREEAVKTAEKLATQGINEYSIVNEPGKLNALSLGVFGLKENAERRSKQLKKLKHKVKTEARYRERTIYWLYHQQSNESDPRPLLSEQDRSNGISQIPRQCT